MNKIDWWIVQDHLEPTLKEFVESLNGRTFRNYNDRFIKVY